MPDAPPPLEPWIIWQTRSARAVLVDRLHVWSYAIRPYDMLADRRRWFWQRPQCCCGLAGTVDALGVVRDARACPFRYRG